MSLIITVFSIALLIALVFTPAVRLAARRWGVLDSPGEYRRIHTGEIPRLGGLVIFAAFWSPILLSMTVFNLHPAGLLIQNTRLLWGLFGGSLLILSVGILDDFRGVRPLLKILIECAAGMVIFLSGFKILSVHTPFGVIHFGMFAILITMLWILVTTNAVNLIDGMDGLATGVCLVGTVVIFVFSVLSGNWISALLMVALAGSALGFLVYNFHPASIFLGDSGSLLLGFLLGSVALLSSSYRHAAVGLAIPLIVFALPIADTLLAIIRRWSKRMRISSSDREHIHHRLLSRGWSQNQVLGILYGITIFLGIMAIVLSMCSTRFQFLIGSFLIGSLFILFRWMKWGDFELFSRRIQRDVQRTRQRSDHWELVNTVGNEIRHVRSEYRLKYLLDRIFEGLDMDRVVLMTVTPSLTDIGKTFSYRYISTRNGSGLGGNNIWSARLQLRGKNRVLGNLHIVKNADRSELPSDISACMRIVCNELASRLLPDKAIMPHQNPGIPDRDNCADAAGKTGKILVVHENESLCTVTTHLMNMNLKVDSAGSLKSAETMLRSRFYHLVFLDTNTGSHGMSLQALLNIDPTLPVVAVGSESHGMDIKAALEQGAIASLNRPVHPETLNHLLKITLSGQADAAIETLPADRTQAG
ncbi:hypothetical protein JXA40_11085 [bacterium]|nr:hypothetical protein [candidate division CSSED10-310 bacterium]